MGNLSPHFNQSEFACRCGCGFDDICPELLYVLECVREHFDSPVIINSACRCRAHNVAIGGSRGSRHILADAADIVVKDVQPADVADYCESLIRDRGGIGRYFMFTHIDTRGYRARWKE